MVYVFLADGFEEVEALTPVDVLRRASVDVRTVGIGERCVTGSHGIKVTSDISSDEALSMLEAEKPEMIVLPGGMPGASNLDSSPVVSKFIEESVKCGAYIGAICAAPMILGKRGLLNGHLATCYPGFEKYLEGAEYCNAPIAVSGKFITSNGMGNALNFALQLTAVLKGEKQRDTISDAVMA